jgi:hypothetical protein
VDISGISKTLKLLLRRGYIYTHVLTYFLLHLQHGRKLLFREHADLKIQMGAPFGLARHAILANQDKNSEHNAF